MWRQAMWKKISQRYRRDILPPSSGYPGQIRPLHQSKFFPPRVILTDNSIQKARSTFCVVLAPSEKFCSASGQHGIQYTEWRMNKLRVIMCTVLPLCFVYISRVIKVQWQQWEQCIIKCNSQPRQRQHSYEMNVMSTNKPNISFQSCFNPYRTKVEKRVSS